MGKVASWPHFIPEKLRKNEIFQRTRIQWNEVHIMQFHACEIGLI